MLWLLAFVPLAPALEYFTPERQGLVFLASALAIIPLAAMLADATETLASRAGTGVGGLLNATFGNAPELIITLSALREGLGDVVKAALAGSIIGNLLAVFGSAALAGGLRHKVQRYGAAAIRSQATMLLLAVVALMLPAIYQAHIPPERSHLAEFSVAISLVLVGCYACFLLFSLVTHRQMFMGEEPGAGEPRDSTARALVLLAVSTLLTGWMSDILVGSLVKGSAALGLDTDFVSLFIVATVSNAAGILTGIRVARKDRLDLALSVGLGSGVQVALFLAPVAVLASFFVGPAPIDLAFPPGIVLAVMLSVLVSMQVAADGESNWLKGVQLLCVYAVIALAYFYRA